MADRRLAVISSHVAGGGGGRKTAPPPFCPRELNKSLLEPHGHYEVRQAILEFLKVRRVVEYVCGRCWAKRVDGRKQKASRIRIGAALDAPFCRAGARLPLRPSPLFACAGVGRLRATAVARDEGEKKGVAGQAEPRQEAKRQPRSRGEGPPRPSASALLTKNAFPLTPTTPGPALRPRLRPILGRLSRPHPAPPRRLRARQKRARLLFGARLRARPAPLHGGAGDAGHG